MTAAVYEYVFMSYKLLKDHLDWTNAAVYSALLFSVWFLYKWGIQPFMSPLLKIPGMPYRPLFGNLPVLLKGGGVESFAEMMHKYGTVFRFYGMFGRERIGLMDPETIRYVSVTNSRNYIKRTIKPLRILMGDGLITRESEGGVHAAHRRLIAPAFNNQSIAKMTRVFEMNAKKLVEFWKRKIVNGDQWTEVSVGTDVTRATLDIIGETAFGYNFNSLEEPDDATAKACWDIVDAGELSYMAFIPYFYQFPFPAVTRIRNGSKVIQNLIDDMVKQKRALIDKEPDKSEVTKDLLGMMMLARDETTGQGLSQQELRDEIMTLIFAGHETSAVALSWCLLYLASNQKIQEKARREIMSELRKDEPLTSENLEKLSYCGNIIKETLRLLPPVPYTVRRALKNDVLPGNVPIPAGTVLILCIGAMMRRPDLYEDPNSFRPERFEKKDEEAAFHNFLPFLIGPRMCLGYKFSLVELRVMLVLLLRHFRFDIIPGAEFKRKMSVTVKPDPPLKLLVSTVCEDFH